MTRSRVRETDENHRAREFKHGLVDTCVTSTLLTPIAVPIYCATFGLGAIYDAYEAHKQKKLFETGQTFSQRHGFFHHNKSQTYQEEWPEIPSEHTYSP